MVISPRPSRHRVPQAASPPSAVAEPGSLLQIVTGILAVSISVAIRLVLGLPKGVADVSGCDFSLRRDRRRRIYRWPCHDGRGQKCWSANPSLMGMFQNEGASLELDSSRSAVRLRRKLGSSKTNGSLSES